MDKISKIDQILLDKNLLEKVLVGKVLSTKGLKGEIKVKSFTADIFNILDYDLFDENASYQIKSAYPHKANGSSNIMVVKFENIDTLEAAQKLVGRDLYIAKRDLPHLEEENYYYVDLEGLKVLNQTHEVIGFVSGIYNFGASDILEIIKLDKSSFMVNFNKKSIPEVNLKDRYLKINLDVEELAQELDQNPTPKVKKPQSNN
ncbi:Ribosome maturation factor RimM [Candidatus Hepatincolaceae symbiont of Richtersius coronifer]